VSSRLKQTVLEYLLKLAKCAGILYYSCIKKFCLDTMDSLTSLTLFSAETMNV